MNGRDVSALELYLRTGDLFDRIVRQIKPGDGDRPTPCTEWDVLALVNHLVGENRWLPVLLAGAHPDEVGNRFDGDLLGDDPTAAWTEARDAARDAVTAEGATDRTVQLSTGPAPATEYLRQVGADQLVHAWDLAIAIGANSMLPADLVAAALTWFETLEPDYRAGGAIADRPTLVGDEDAQTLLLAMFGRNAPRPSALEVVESFGIAFDSRDVDSIMATMTADCVFESTAPPDGVRYVGQAAVRLAWETLFTDSDDAYFTTESVLVSGDRVVAQWRYDWSGDNPGHVRGVDIFLVAGALVAEKSSYVKG